MDKPEIDIAGLLDGKPAPITREDFIKLATKFGNTQDQINDLLAALKLKEIE